MSTCQDCKKILPQTTNKYNRRYCDECLFLNRNKSFFSHFNIDVSKFSRKELENKMIKTLTNLYHKKKMSLREIANKFKIPVKTLYFAFKRFNIKIRTHKESMDLSVKNGNQPSLFKKKF